MNDQSNTQTATLDIPAELKRDPNAKKVEVKQDVEDIGPAAEIPTQPTQ